MLFKLHFLEGGHTSEMMKLVENLKIEKYSPRHYVIAKTDKISTDKVRDFERNPDKKFIHHIKRSRFVGQSYFSSIFTTVIALFLSIPLVYKIQPKLLIVNGPGTCIPICIVAFFLSVINFLVGLS